MGKNKEENAIHQRITRRDLLKVMGAGAMLALSPIPGFGEARAEFAAGKGRGLIFLVGDGMPLGVIRGMHEISTSVLKNSDTHFYSLMRDSRARVGYMGTKSLSSIVTDSAPASVAWSTGSKTANRMLAALPDGRPLKTIMELLREEGYACGLVTTTRVTHATPAAWVSHQPNRDDEEAIALDYLSFQPEVLLGGGTRQFDAARRKDKRDLFAEFARAGYAVFRDKEGLLSHDPSSDRRLFGVFNPSHLSYYVDRLNNTDLDRREPSLPGMTQAALKRLSQHPKGFILQVEAGRIDHANHANDAWGSLMDMYEMDLTLGVIRQYLAKNPQTLLIIVSDHGNAGWGINGTGVEYNDSTEALRKYTPIRASFEVMGAQMRGKTPAEIKGIFEQLTTLGLTDGEANLIFESLQPGYRPFPGDFLNYPDTILGRILAHSEYRREGGRVVPVIRRGNVGFTSSTHTGEDQLYLAYGQRAEELGLTGYIENTDIFKALLGYFGIRYRNPAMTAEAARPLIKALSAAQWERHMRLHVT